MALERIDSIFDLQSISSEVKQLQQYLGTALSSITELNDATKKVGNSNFGNSVENAKNLNMAMTGTVKVMRDVQDASEKVNSSVKKSAATFAEADAAISAQSATFKDNAVSIKENASSLDTLVQQMVRNKIANDNLNNDQKTLKQAYEDGRISIEQYEEALGRIKTSQLALKASNTEVTDAINAQNAARGTSVEKTDEQIKSDYAAAQAKKLHTKEVIAQSDAYKLLDLQYQKAAANAKTLQAVAVQARAKADVSGAPEDQDAAAKATSAAQAASAAANAINTRLKQIDSSVGESRRKVGDYTGALKVLEAALFEVNAKMSTLAQAGQQDTAAYAKMAEEAGLLNVLVGQQERGFSSVTMEIRNSERALQTLRAEGFGAGEAFDKLRESTTLAAREQKEFNRQQKLLESEAPVLGAITIAAKALAGAYALGAGAAALFADGDEKVAKEINKLVAIMTILQGLEEVNRLIQQEGAIAKAFNTAQTGLLTTATEIYAASVEGATIATDSFAASLIATGIGAVIIAVVAGIGLLVAKLIELAGADERAVKMQKELAEATKELNDIFQKEIDILAKSNQDQIEFAKNQIDISKAIGTTKEKELAAKKVIADLEADQAKKAFESASKIAQVEQENIKFQDFQIEKKRELSILNEKLKKGEIDIVEFNTKSAEINSRHVDETITKENALAASRDYHMEKYSEGLIKLQDLQETAIVDEKAGKEIPDALKHKIDAQKAIVSLEEDAKNKAEALVNKSTQTQKDAAVAQNDIEKSSADEQRKIILETVKLKSGLIKSSNDILLNDERTTLNTRLALMKSNADEEIKVIRAENAAIQSDPTVSDKDKALNTKKTFDEIIKVTAKSTEDNRKVIVEAARKEQEEKLTLLKLQVQEQIDADTEIINSENSVGQHIKTSLTSQLTALADYYTKKQSLLQSDLQFQLSAPELQGEDSPEKQQKRLVLFAKYEASLNSLQDDFGKKRVAIEQQVQKQILADWDLFYKKRKLQISNAFADELKGINQAELDGNLSREDAADKRAANEDKRRLDDLQNQASHDQILLSATKEGTQERIDAEQKLQDDAINIDEQRVKNHENAEDRIKAASLRRINYVKEIEVDAVTAVGNFIQINLERRKVDIENLQTKEDKAYENNIKNIQNSTLAETDKAAKLIVLEKTHQSQQLQNARRLKEIEVEKARFDKAKAVLEIIVNTAAAVVKALPDIPLAIAVGVLGASELALAVATPLPTYRKGTEDHPGGEAIVHPQEIIIEPGKAPVFTLPNYESKVNLAEHTKVIPKERVEKIMDLSKHATIIDSKEVQRLNTLSTQRVFIDQAGKLREVIILDQTAQEVKELRKDIQFQTYALSKAYSKNRPVVKIINKNDTGWRARIDDQVRH